MLVSGRKVNIEIYVDALFRDNFADSGAAFGCIFPWGKAEKQLVVIPATQRPVQYLLVIVTAAHCR